MHYLFRSTTDKVAGHIDRIEGDGDVVESVHFTGGRDWVLICRKAVDQ